MSGTVERGHPERSRLQAERRVSDSVDSAASKSPSLAEFETRNLNQTPTLNPYNIRTHPFVNIIG